MTDPRLTLWDWVRSQFRDDTLHDRLTRMENTMATAKDQLTDLKTAFTDFAADVDAKLNQLIEAQGNLTPDAQAVFDELKAAVADADTRVGDADGSDTPPTPEEPTEPTDPTVPGEFRSTRRR
ncbi:hypothetical protein OOJ91_12200 [Micromonospora lupini]|uniref:hypothetical protein n=1 Tax=Micromonospora lupini TaxID=285679 RepID=UPI0022534667|nr:hypothetical protein [Micromonospora lupini]MCX5066640.1 hypothetical protein [Micromonospora lupini]